MKGLNNEKNSNRFFSYKKTTVIIAVLFMISLLSACTKTKPESSSNITSPSKSNQTTLTYESNAQDTITEAENIIPDYSQDTTSTTKTNPTTTPAPTTTATEPPDRPSVKIVIKEGETLTEIFKKLSAQGVGTFEGLLNAARTYDYTKNYPLIAAIPKNDRIFKLEGYLFPDTYNFHTGKTAKDAENAIGVMLRNGKNKITAAHQSKASALGFSMDEIITIASIIEKEGAKKSEGGNISAVIHNRLKVIGVAGSGIPRLQMDSTKDYIKKVKAAITNYDEKYTPLYDTYVCKKLPAGPISNPGLQKIEAALNPSNVDYLYFCHDKNAKYYYAATLEVHNANVAEMKRVNAE